MTFSKTRIAPTPSGFIHLGNAFSFAVTAALAHKHNARVLLRIDDLDRDRMEEIYLEDIFETLHFLGITWDEGPRGVSEFHRSYAQIHRLDLYGQALQELKDEGAVFACTCSRTQVLRNSPDGTYPGTCRDKGIPLDQPDAAWRLRTPEMASIRVKTLSGYEMADWPREMTDFVVRKKDGMPAYQLASVIDDLHFGIDLVIRGQDLWASTIAQHYLAEVLGKPAFGEITFYHHALLLQDQGDKLSKSSGATSIQHFRKQGKRPEYVYGLIAQKLGLTSGVHNWKTLGQALGIQG